MKLKILIIFLAILSSCNKDRTETLKSEDLPGGKGGIYNIAIFPEFHSKGYSGKVYIKYGSRTQPKDGQYNDSSNTMTEPGFTHHAHFFYLKEGYYAIKAKCLVDGVIRIGDTTIEINNLQSKSVDYNLNLK